ncbi:hypothetical protein HIV01_009145 [Lysobacter arenosi]|jgi:hypothetical protein|uniref:Secreted protein n=1 Tax=Lysobacter arenosi TaxID=2795387 RepID=A0ABX7RGS0_9GAMM|nr:hypothetical protein [Lysobacter arenosi]QSX76607.1 hypothetical protein HIV01_009145 [Lysobacter arenosi]
MLRLSTMVIAVLLMLCACAAPPADPAQAATPQPAATPVAPAAPPAPTPAAGPAPAQSVAAPAAIKIDRSCRSDNDCAIKDVGNCCGAMPACVNVNSPTDPQGVQDACAKSGRMGVCGFRQIESCQCVQGQCKEQASALEQGPEQVR